MGMIEAFMFLACFFMIYGAFTLVAFAVDKALKKITNRGIFPHQYFSHKE